MTAEMIWKFPLVVTDSQMVEMPVGAKILAFQCQQDLPYVWAQVDPNAMKVPRHFVIVGTGHPIPLPPEFCTQRFIGTAQMYDGQLVWHLFEVEHP